MKEGIPSVTFSLFIPPGNTGFRHGKDNLPGWEYQTFIKRLQAFIKRTRPFINLSPTRPPDTVSLNPEANQLSIYETPPIRVALVSGQRTLCTIATGIME